MEKKITQLIYRCAATFPLRPFNRGGYKAFNDGLLAVSYAHYFLLGLLTKLTFGLLVGMNGLMILHFLLRKS